MLNNDYIILFMNKRLYGGQGEDVAGNYLIKKGYRLICRNYRTRIGEIDIIAKKGDCVIFCEVKTRKNKRFGEPFEAVNAKKQRKIKIIARIFLMKKKFQNSDVRFDVLSIMDEEGLYKIEHLVNAF